MAIRIFVPRDATACALGADVCEIYTDVDGVYTTDPRLVPHARKLECISYEEMLEMASMGAKVLQIRSVKFAMRYGVPIHVRSSFRSACGLAAPGLDGMPYGRIPYRTAPARGTEV